MTEALKENVRVGFKHDPRLVVALLTTKVANLRLFILRFRF